MDQTREYVLNLRRQKQEDEEELEKQLKARARRLKVFYDALCEEGFAEEAALLLTVNSQL